MIVDAMFEHMVDDAGKFMGSCNNCFGCSMTRLEASIKGTERTVGTSKGLGSHSQSRGRSIVTLASTAAFYLTTGYFVIGRKTTRK